MKIFICFVLSVTISLAAFSQNIPKKYDDINWTFYNANINMFLSTGIGAFAKGGINEEYVNNNLSVNHHAFHNYNGFYMEAYSIVNFDHPANKPHFNMKFGNGSEATFAESIHYLADKYAQLYAGPKLQRFFSDVETDSIKKTFKLIESKRIMFHDYWYYDTDSQRLVPIIRGIGLIAKEEKGNNYVAWIDMRYFDEAVLKRIMVITPAGKKIPFDQYLQNRPFIYENVESGYSKYPDQARYDIYNTELNCAFELANMENQFKNDLPKMKIKKGKLAKSKLLKGEILAGEMNGLWTLKYSNGKLRAQFNFSKGKAVGNFKLYYDNGDLAQEGQLVEGKKDGVITDYFKGGAIMSKKSFDLGLCHGDHELFFNDGKPHSKFSFVYGVLTGNFIQYNEDGSEKLNGAFKNDVIIGEWKFNLPFNEFLCDFIDEEIQNQWPIIGAEKDCMKDCVASFEYKYVHTYEKHCQRGLCLNSHRIGDVK
ncbi:MAG: toxin-antitoxin system YwqK family antitoxin [Salibacteraceae bacterium]